MASDFAGQLTALVALIDATGVSGYVREDLSLDSLPTGAYVVVDALPSPTNLSFGSNAFSELRVRVSSWHPASLQTAATNLDAVIDSARTNDWQVVISPTLAADEHWRGVTAEMVLLAALDVVKS